MPVSHVLGYPKTGQRRELKVALEDFCNGAIDEAALFGIGRLLRARDWLEQRDAGLDPVTVGDFAWYDHVLQTLAHLGALPSRFGFDPRGLTIRQYFEAARGNARQPAMELTKWFDTNHHYIVPEWTAETRFDGGVEWLFDEVSQAIDQEYSVKVALVGPLTLLHLGQIKSGLSDKLNLLPPLIDSYHRLLLRLEASGVDWVQLDEPILGLDLDQRWLEAVKPTYEVLTRTSCAVLLATYFESVEAHACLLKSLPVAGIHLDLVRGPGQLSTFLKGYPDSKVLSLGVIDGRNIGRSDLDAALDQLRPAYEQLGDLLWISASCSLLHVPPDLTQEKTLDPDVHSWPAFAKQKLTEIDALNRALVFGVDAVVTAQADSRAAVIG